MPDLPKDQKQRAPWVISAETSDELRRRYDQWAETYDADLEEVEREAEEPRGWWGRRFSKRRDGRSSGSGSMPTLMMGPRSSRQLFGLADGLPEDGGEGLPTARDPGGPQCAGALDPTARGAPGRSPSR